MVQNGSDSEIGHVMDMLRMGSISGQFWQPRVPVLYTRFNRNRFKMNPISLFRLKYSSQR